MTKKHHSKHSSHNGFVRHPTQEEVQRYLNSCLLDNYLIVGVPFGHPINAYCQGRHSRLEELKEDIRDEWHEIELSEGRETATSQIAENLKRLGVSEDVIKAATTFS